MRGPHCRLENTFGLFVEGKTIFFVWFLGPGSLLCFSFHIFSGHTRNWSVCWTRAVLSYPSLSLSLSLSHFLYLSLTLMPIWLERSMSRLLQMCPSPCLWLQSSGQIKHHIQAYLSLSLSLSLSALLLIFLITHCLRKQACKKERASIRIERSEEVRRFFRF